MEEIVEKFEGLSIPERLALYTPLYPEAVKLKKGSRQICDNSKKGRKEYANRREFLIAVYGGMCALCGRKAVEPTMEHPDGRGAGGCNRNDSVLVCLIACWNCNVRKASRRIVQDLDCPFCEHSVVVGGKKDRECFRCDARWTEGQNASQ